MKRQDELVNTRPTAAVAAACLAGTLLTGFVPTDAATVNAADAVAAIQDVAPEAVLGSAGTASGTDPDTAATLENEALTVTAPAEAVDGIRFAVEDAPAITIGLPFAQEASDAAESQVPGVVVYDNNDGSSTVPVIREDGSVQITTVIDDAEAPKRYAYPIQLPDGAVLQLADDGSVRSVGAGEDAPALSVAAPWAKDADGNAVPTHYEVLGSTLTQVVDFTARTAFPVVADPAVYVDYTTSQVINLVDHGAQSKWKYLNACTAAAGKSCSISRTYEASATIQTALNVSAATVGSSIGIGAGAGVKIQVTCGVSKGPGTVNLYAQAVKKTYQVLTTRHYGVQAVGSKVKTEVKTSGTLAAYKPNGKYSCL